MQEEEFTKISVYKKNLGLKRKPVFNMRDLAISMAGLIFCMIFFVYPTVLHNKESLALVLESLKENPFDAFSIEAEAAYVFDLSSNKELFAKNQEISLPLASLTKIMTAVAALRAVPETTTVSISQEDLRLEGDSGLYANEKWRLDDLLKLTLIESSNDGAEAVAGNIGKLRIKEGEYDTSRDAFIELMNEEAEKLGLNQSRFSNPTGLDISEFEAGAYGSGRDMALLLGYGVNNYPDVFGNTKYSSVKMESLSDLSHVAINTNKELNGIPVIIASKTGFTDLAGGNLAIVFDAGLGHMMVVVVLHSSVDGRFEDVRKLSWAALDFLSTGQ